MGWRRVTVLQIEKSMSLGQAGAIINYMRGKLPKGAPIRFPSRVALGVTDREADKMLEQTSKESLKRLQKQGIL